MCLPWRVQPASARAGEPPPPRRLLEHYIYLSHVSRVLRRLLFHWSASHCGDGRWRRHPGATAFWANGLGEPLLLLQTRPCRDVV